MNKILASAGLCMAMTAVQAGVIDFDDNALAADSYYDPQAATVWSSGDATFNHGWNDLYNCCWDGFTYSNKTDTTTAGYLNDRSAITGDGQGAGQDNYAIGYTGNGGSVMNFASAQTVAGGYFTNATYAYLAMANGDDGNTPAWVKGPFGEDDFFNLTVTGLDAAGSDLTSLTFALADGANVVNSWEWFDLAGLGVVNGLRFDLSSSDTGDFGMNTPAYFAMDSISIVPVPAAVWLFVSALGALGFGRFKKGLR